MTRDQFDRIASQFAKTTDAAGRPAPEILPFILDRDCGPIEPDPAFAERAFRLGGPPADRIRRQFASVSAWLDANPGPKAFEECQTAPDGLRFVTYSPEHWDLAKVMREAVGDGGAIVEPMQAAHWVRRQEWARQAAEEGRALPTLTPPAEPAAQ